jgi:hypothetical protein
MREEQDKGNEAVSLAEFNDLEETVADIASRVEAVEKHVRTRNPNEQINTIKDLVRRVEAIEQHIRQHHPNDMK